MLRAGIFNFSLYPWKSWIILCWWSFSFGQGRFCIRGILIWGLRRLKVIDLMNWKKDNGSSCRFKIVLFGGQLTFRLSQFGHGKHIRLEIRILSIYQELEVTFSLLTWPNLPFSTISKDFSIAWLFFLYFSLSTIS